MSDKPRITEVITAVSTTLLCATAVLAFAWWAATQPLPSNQTKREQPSYAAQRCESARKADAKSRSPNRVPKQKGQADQTSANPPDSSSTVPDSSDAGSTVTDWCDLVVQEHMAQSARWAFWITAAGVVLVLMTLVYTRRAANYAESAVTEAKRGADEARRGADAAEAAVIETRRIGEAQLRAYVSVIPSVVPQLEGSDYDASRDFLLTIKNSGQSPARNVRLVSAATWIRAPLPQPCADLIRFNKDETPRYITISASSDQGVFANSSLTDRDFFDAHAQREGRCPGLVGIITYDDVFDRSHKVRFAFYASAMVDTSAVPKVGDEVVMSIRLTAANEHNDGD